ncbi:MAG TPA: hypothetical protein VN231_02580, partial [Allosphingosinicella sp.]|nr:hypothetical protein [Allosphingosinicella sp.]
WDADARRGLWAVNNDGRAVPYEAPWRRTELPYSPRRRWTAPAPAIAVPAPAVEVAGRAAAAGVRRVSLRLRLNGAESVTLLAPPEADLRFAGSGAFVRPLGSGSAEDRFIVRCVGRACDGATLYLVIGSAEPVEFTIVGTRTGLPPAAAPLVRARPALARPQYMPDSTVTVAKLRL